MGDSHLFLCPRVVEKPPWHESGVPSFFSKLFGFLCKRSGTPLSCHGGFCTCKKTSDVLRARGTLFWHKIARELTKSDGTRTIRSEIARGIVSNRSRGPEMHKMRVFDPGSPRGTPGGIPRRFSAKTNSKPRSDFDFFFVRDPFTRPFQCF